jgi:phage repressor protein C with HTH and peptisase S24 domain
MDFREKIDNLLRVKELQIRNIDDLEAKMGLGAEKEQIGDQTIRKAYNENRNPSRKTQGKIISRFNLNPEWWETGTGPIFTENGTRVNEPESGKYTVNKKIPFYDVYAVGGDTMLADQTPISQPAEMINPGTFLNSATGTLRVYGHSMFPKYPSGCVVAFKNTSMTVILWGEDYVIELADRRIVKRVEKGESKDSIKAVSYNINKDSKYMYDPIEIPLKEVKRLYMVLGKIELEASV